jgi:hypothetical protein
MTPNDLPEVGFLFCLVACLVLAALNVRKGPPNLLLHRIAFLAAIAVCVLLATAFVTWDVTLELGERKWEMESVTGPLWWPPSLSSFTRTRKSGDLQTVFQLPPPDTPGLTISRGPHLREMVGSLLFYLWWVLMLFGAVYFVGRGDRQDLLLHCGVGIWCSLTTAVALAYIAIPTILGSHPAPMPFAYVGIIIGLAVAAHSWKDEPK